MRENAVKGAGEVRTVFRSGGITRDCGSIVLGLTVAYLLLAVLPFYGNGIHLHSFRDISGSLVDVKGYPPFVWFLPLQALAMLAAGYTPLVSLLLTPLTLLLVVARRRQLSRGELAFLGATCLANVAALALTWQERGIILAWLTD
jgi:hypothetical protein